MDDVDGVDDVIVRLSPAAHVFVRPGPALQFGIDATRAGVIDFIDREALPRVMRALLRARSAISWAELRRELVSAGLRLSAAETVLEELLTYRILRPAAHNKPREVYVLGHSSLAYSLITGLKACGFRVHSATMGENDQVFLQRCVAETPLLVVDRLPHSRKLAPTLVQRGGTFIPVSLIDGRGIIGPLFLAGRGPCPLCMDMHRIDTDRHWPTLLAQIAGAHGVHDPITVQAVVSRAAAVLSSVLETADEPPGGPTPRFHAGDVLEVDAFGLEVPMRSYATHPGCPTCWR